MFISKLAMINIIKYSLAAMTVWIAALGIAFFYFDAQDAPPQSRDIQSAFEQAMPPSGIMRTNLRCVMLNMSGIAFAGIPALLNLFYNGFLSGVVLRQISTTSLQFSELYYYGRHHAIEFLALWLSGGIGLCGISLFRAYCTSGKLPEKNILYSLSFSALAVIVITVFAAVMETEISLAAYHKIPPEISSVDSLVVIPREAWFAHPADPQAARRHRDDSLITSVIIHHSGFPGTTGPLRVQEYQMNIRGMDDIAYHYYITSDGCVFEGRSASEPGEHTSANGGSTRPNDISIGICLGGNYETESAGPPLNQRIALGRVLVLLRSRYAIDADHIFLHRDFNAEPAAGTDSLRVMGTVCPGRFAIAPLSQLIDTLEGL